jgi:hypothetical protein
MAEAVAHWLRDDVAPVIATLGTSLRGIETLASFECRPRNGITGGKISEHSHANALDVHSLKLADGRAIWLTDETVSKSLRENLRQSACARFTTVLGNGADPYHESHVHLDLLEWDVLDVAQSAAFAAKKAAAAANALPALARDVPLPRPRPVVTTLSRHRREHFHEATRGPVFYLISPLRNYTH